MPDNDAVRVAQIYVHPRPDQNHQTPISKLEVAHPKSLVTFGLFDHNGQWTRKQKYICRNS